jgi:hypothetical protein
LLIKGESILGHDGAAFHLRSEAAQKVLSWYSMRQGRWQMNVNDDDVEESLSAMTTPLARTKPASQPTPSSVIQRWHLRRIRAHRFAGLHRFDPRKNQPQDFELLIDGKLISLTGKNGTGKTSLLNAITWCLTGHIYRAQRIPEPAGTVVVTATDDTGTAEIPVVSPVPPSDAFSGGGSVTVDTWVELEFHDNVTDSEAKVRRSVGRNSRGGFEPKFNISGMTLDAVAFHIGTRLPGLVPYIQLSKRSPFGAAVAALTGFESLLTLVAHSSRLHDRVRNRTLKAAQRELDGTRETITRIVSSIDAELPALEACGVTAPSDLRSPEGLAKWQQVLNMTHSQLLHDAGRVLPTFKDDDASQRFNLSRLIEPAIAAIDMSALKRGRTAQRLSRLQKLTDAQCETVDRLLLDLSTEAKLLAEQLTNTDMAQRTRLYARVAAWLKESDQTVGDLCPVCGNTLASAIDAVSGQPVREHIANCTLDSTTLSHTTDSWVASAKARLASVLPDDMHTELAAELPRQPHDLLRAALVDEIFSDPAFSAPFDSLRPRIAALCDEALKAMPTMEEPTILRFARPFTDSGAVTLVTRLHRIVAFARWRKENEKGSRDVFKRVIGLVREQNGADTSIVDARPLAGHLVAIRRLVEASRPVTNAIDLADNLAKALNLEATLKRRIGDCQILLACLIEIGGIKKLVDGELKALIKELNEETIAWKNRLYGSVIGAPQLDQASVAVGGNVSLRLAVGGTGVPAEAIANASHLRASLIAFLFAFWEYRWERLGGLSLLLLDDVHELFDPENRSRIASAIPLLVERGAHVICTSNDESFSRDLTLAAKRRSVEYERRCIHPLTLNRSCVVVGVYEAEIDGLRREFEKSPGEDEPAINYLMAARVYFEERLIDFFDTPDPQITATATLHDLLGAARRSRRLGVEPFDSLAIGHLLDNPALADGSQLLDLLNRSVHRTRSTLRYCDADAVQSELQNVRELMEAAYGGYQHWLRRDLPSSPLHAPSVLSNVICQIPCDVPVRWQLAAFTRGGVDAGGRLSKDETFDLAWFAGKAAYRIARPTFGFACPRGSIAIVDPSDDDILDNRLVIALHGTAVYARRLLRSERSSTYIALGSEDENPLNRAHSLFLPRSEVQLLKVVGVLFEAPSTLISDPVEALAIDIGSRLMEVETAYRVEGDSALPLALPNQLVLGGTAISPAELPKDRRSIVALETSTGKAVLKRVGACIDEIQGLHMFESIGGSGDSMAAYIVRPIKPTQIPVVRRSRRIVGVLYEPRSRIPRSFTKQ